MTPKALSREQIYAQLADWSDQIQWVRCENVELTTSLNN